MGRATDVKMDLDDAIRELGVVKDRAIEGLRHTADELADELRLANEALQLFPVDLAKADHVVALDFELRGEVPSGHGVVAVEVQGYGHGDRVASKLTKTIQAGAYRALLIITRTKQ